LRNISLQAGYPSLPTAETVAAGDYITALTPQRPFLFREKEKLDQKKKPNLSAEKEKIP